MRYTPPAVRPSGPCGSRVARLAVWRVRKRQQAALGAGSRRPSGPLGFSMANRLCDTSLSTLSTLSMRPFTGDLKSGHRDNLATWAKMAPQHGCNMPQHGPKMAVQHYNILHGST